jgi:hypothetical protein
MNSKLLEEAIIDAEALREAALKNAEQVILEKYAPEVKLAIENLLEQEPGMESDPMAMGGDLGMGQTQQDQKEMNVPYKAMDGESLCACPDDNEKVLVSVDDLTDAMEKLMADLARGNSVAEEEPEMPMDMGTEQPEDMSMQPEISPDTPLEDEEEEEEVPQQPMTEEIELEITEEMIASLLSEEEEEKEEEELTDKEKKLAALASPEDKITRADIITGATKEKTNESKSLTLKNSKLLVEKKKILDENKLLTEKLNKLLEENEKTKQTALQISQRLEESNLLNAKLLYKNQALGSDSLNERQKNKIVEAVSKAGSVDEAKMIYETLCNAVETFDNKGPQSLSEAVEKKGGLTLKPRQQTNSNSNPLKNRWQKIAGIK